MARGGFFSVDSLKGIHVLVLDRDPEGRELLTAVLSYCGGLVTAVASVDEAVAFLNLVKADAMMVDASASSPAGYDLIRHVRALKPEDGGVIPAVAVGSPDEAGERALASGFNAYLTKPLDPWELCRVISNLVTTS